MKNNSTSRFPNFSNFFFFFVRLSVYIQESRNLLKVKDFPRRKDRLRVGKENVVKYLAQLPKTQHDLSSFVVDLTFFTVSFFSPVIILSN